jgi:hypothetical protein
MDADALIADYLGRLRAASWPLPAARREELQGEVAEHIDAALADAGARDAVSVRNVLERLGAPEEIVATEGDGPGSTPTTAAPAATRSWGATEILAILFLTVGSVFLPFIGPIVGLLFMWGSRLWSTRVRAVATLIVVVLLALPIVVVIAGRLLY